MDRVKARKRMNWRRRTNPLNQENASRLLWDVSDALPIDHWLAFGTALGAVRESQFISHDTDIDIAVRNEDFNALDRQAFLDRLVERNISCLRSLPEIITVARDHIPLDIYLFHAVSANSKWYECLGTYRIERLQIDGGLSEIEFCGKTYNLVKEPVRYLTRLYGRNWRTPRKRRHARC